VNGKAENRPEGNQDPEVGGAGSPLPAANAFIRRGAHGLTHHLPGRFMANGPKAESLS
jgi:hypothetical protein